MLNDQRVARRQYEREIAPRGCYLGAGCMILPGVTVGERAVVASGAVVTRDVEPATVVAGVPARPLRPIGPLQGGDPP